MAMQGTVYICIYIIIPVTCSVHTCVSNKFVVCTCVLKINYVILALIE